MWVATKILKHAVFSIFGGNLREGEAGERDGYTLSGVFFRVFLFVENNMLKCEIVGLYIDHLVDM